MANHGSLQLRSAVHHAYSAAAERPTQKHAFPVGRLLAERLGYPAGVLDTLPPECVEAFVRVLHATGAKDAALPPTAPSTDPPPAAPAAGASEVAPPGGPPGSSDRERGAA